jgi:hypothetical protein
MCTVCAHPERAAAVCVRVGRRVHTLTTAATAALRTCQRCVDTSTLAQNGLAGVACQSDDCPVYYRLVGRNIIHGGRFVTDENSSFAMLQTCMRCTN